MYERQPIRYNDARKAVRRNISSSIPESRKLSRPGAFHFQVGTFGRLVIVDDIVLTDEERSAFEPYLASSDLVHRRTAAVMLKENAKIWEFIAPHDVDFQELNKNPALLPAPLWFFERQAWCLPHIFAGLTCYEDDSPIALKHYDAKFAISHHDRMHARNSLARHQTAA